jgi:hypothetical protein
VKQGMRGAMTSVFHFAPHKLLMFPPQNLVAMEQPHLPDSLSGSRPGYDSGHRYRNQIEQFPFPVEKEFTLMTREKRKKKEGGGVGYFSEHGRCLGFVWGEPMVGEEVS